MKLQWMLILCFGLLSTQTIALLSNDCPTSQCTCQGEDLDCSNKGLRAVPTFVETFAKFRNIYLDNNRITTIYSYDFTNLVTFDEVYIRLSNNFITTIQDGAFSKLVNVTLRLELNQNTRQFDTYLRNLTVKELSIDRITSLDITTLFALGASLETLNIGMESVSVWPEGLKSLRHLKNLTLSGIKMATIPDSAFHGFENSLHTLTIKQSSLTRLPDALCFLKHLDSITLVSRTTPESRSLAPYCQSPLTSVKSLTVDDDKLTDFPDVFHAFPGLTHLNITRNPNLRYIREAALPDHMSIASLNLSRNGFRQVPWAIKSLRALKSLDLSYNEISTVEGNDFTGLPPITGLVLTGNPIDYISPTAFSGVAIIKTLDLRHTNLTTIPNALLQLTAPSAIDLRNNQIECSCDLAWIKTWAKKFSTSIIGNCFFSTESISTFVITDLNDC